MKLATWNVNSPNGRAVDSPAFVDKLSFLEALAARAPELDALLGDLNVTRDDLDVYDPAAFEGSTHVTPSERVRLEAMLGTGLRDAYRKGSKPSDHAPLLAEIA